MLKTGKQLGMTEDEMAVLFGAGCALVFVRQFDEDAAKAMLRKMSDSPFRRLVFAALEFRRSFTPAEIKEMESADVMQLILKLHEKFWMSADEQMEGK